MAILLAAPATQVSVASEPMTATILQMPALKTGLTGVEFPYLVKFTGGAAKIASSCGELAKTASLSARWISSTKEVHQKFDRLLWYGDGQLYRTVSLDPEGITCIFSFGSWEGTSLVLPENPTWGDDALYAFKADERSTQIKIDILSSGASIGSQVGTLGNPRFSAYRVEIRSPSRGQAIQPYFELQLSGELPQKADVLATRVLIDGVECRGLLATRCVSFETEVPEVIGVLNIGAGISPSVQVIIDYRSSDGTSHTTVSQPVSVILDNQIKPIPISKIAKSGLVVNTRVSCDSTSIKTGQILNCAVYPRVDSTSLNVDSPGQVFAEVPLTIQTKVKGGPWVAASTMSVFSDIKTQFKIRAPKLADSYLEIRALPIDFPAGAVQAKTYGRAVGNFANQVSLPSVIRYGKNFSVTARPVGGTASKCEFLVSGNTKPVATARVIGGLAKTNMSLVWAARAGVAYEIAIYSRCYFGSKTNLETSFTTGIR